MLESSGLGHHPTEPMTQNSFYGSAVVRTCSLELGLVASLTTCAILGKLLNHSEPQFPQWNKDASQKQENCVS